MHVKYTNMYISLVHKVMLTDTGGIDIEYKIHYLKTFREILCQPTPSEILQDVIEAIAVGLISSCSNTILSRPESELSHERRRPVVDTAEEEV